MAYKYILSDIHKTAVQAAYKDISVALILPDLLLVQKNTEVISVISSTIK